jgi:sirohydrochlorin cobaltochelatase
VSRALVLLAHGARNPAWAAPFEQLAAHLAAERPGWTVALAFLELMPPDLPSCLRDLARAGVRDVEVFPLFLGGSGHVLRDVPPLLDEAQQQHGLRITLHAALGQQPGMVDAMAQVCLAALERPRP